MAQSPPDGPNGTGTLHRQVVEGIRGHGIFVLDPGGRIVVWNAGAERISGYRPEDAVGRRLSFLSPPEERREEALDRDTVEAMSSGRSESEGWWLRKDGDRVWGRRSLFPLHDPGDGVVGFGGILCDLTAQREEQERVARREEMYRSLFDHNPDAVFSLDRDGRLTSANPACAPLLGEGARELRGSVLFSRVAPEQREEAWSAFRRACAGEPQSLELTVRGAGGEAEELQLSLLPIRAGGHVVGVWAVARDVTGQRRAERALRESEERFRLIVEGTEPGFFYVMDDRHRFTYLSPSVERVIGYTPEELLGRPFESLLVWEPMEASELPGGRHPPEEPAPLTVSVQHRRGDRVVLELVESPARSQGERVGTQGFARDATRQKQLERQLVHEALHDTLTGLSNRTLFRDRLERSVRQAERWPERLFAVLMVDLDRFKLINDTLGHAVGDQLLVGVARRLEGCVRPGDTVCRFGGDEFILLIDDIHDVSDATRVARRIEEALDEPFRFGEDHVFASASIGIALGAGEYASPDELVRHADTALYRAKALGSGRHEVFDRALREATRARLQLEFDLRGALERGELRVDYQPIVSLSTGAIWAFEALVRWHHPTRGIIGPSEFVPIAEDTGLIVAIDLWVLREACGQLHAWQQRFPGVPLKVSVNLSGKQFLHQDMVAQIRHVLEQTRVDALSLKLEITESILAERAESSAAILQELKEMDVHLQIDDFGTGYSSLSRLSAFPVDTLKIDRSFVSRNGGNTEIVRAVVSLAHSLGLTVVAEGVETDEQLARMRALECDYAQGFLLSRPLDRSGAETMIAAGGAW